MSKILKDIMGLPIKALSYDKTKFDAPFVIVRVDGGICSQICFYSLGKYFSDKGYRVKYDLTWFDEFGMDIDNKFQRNFDLLKAFKINNFEIATKEEIEYYKKNFPLKSKIYQIATPPVYVGRYYDYTNLLKKYKNDFINIFNPELDDDNKLWLSKIQSQTSCAIHVRRGDLSNCKFSYYGKTATANYFINAIEYVKNKNSETKFFFFSDEIDWVKTEIVPKLNSIDYEIVECNGSNKGYLDLYLISKCSSFITSLGSLAKTGALLSKNPINTNDKTGVIIVSTQDKNLHSLKACNGMKIIKIKNE